jgi:hypothetical protein
MKELRLKIGMHKITLLWALASAVILLTACASPTIATVNGMTITADRFKERYTFDTYLWTTGRGPSGITNTKGAGTLVLDTLIDETIVRQKADEAGLDVTDLEYLDKAKEVLGEGGLEAIIQQTTQATGIKEDRVRVLWREQITGLVLTEKLSDAEGRPIEDLLTEWRSDAKIDINPAWQTYIPATP